VIVIARHAGNKAASLESRHGSRTDDTHREGTMYVCDRFFIGKFFFKRQWLRLSDA